MSEPVTVENLTDEQIRAWESDVFAHGTTVEKCIAVDLATRALVALEYLEKEERTYRHIARIGVAAAINARRGGGR